jgi:hypothetical protein
MAITARWISVKERLPDELRSVLVHGKHKNEYYGGYGVTWLSHGQWVGDVHPVTHWRKLPKAPGKNKMPRRSAAVLSEKLCPMWICANKAHCFRATVFNRRLRATKELRTIGMSAARRSYRREVIKRRLKDCSDRHCTVGVYKKLRLDRKLGGEKH